VRLVLVHGFAQSPSVWDALRSHLPGVVGTQRIEVSAPAVPDGLDFASTARAVVEGGGPAVYCGYSMGGRLCLHGALDVPDVVRALVLVSASPGIADDEARARRARADDELAAEAGRFGVEEFLRRWQAQPMFSTMAVDPQDLSRRAAAMTVERIAHQLGALGQGAQAPLWDRVRELSMPVTVVTGRADAKYEAIGDAVAAAIAGSRRVHLDGGHALVVEQPAALAGVLVDTVRRLTGHVPTP
jgi:2-succinyl-6-hydroxy-2,4-cyclohexadiene-1-carboxylate synthase